jgi:hypothetical protein
MSKLSPSFLPPFIPVDCLVKHMSSATVAMCFPDPLLNEYNEKKQNVTIQSFVCLPALLQLKPQNLLLTRDFFAVVGLPAEQQNPPSTVWRNQDGIK